MLQRLPFYLAANGPQKTLTLQTKRDAHYGKLPTMGLGARVV